MDLPVPASYEEWATPLYMNFIRLHAYRFNVPFTEIEEFVQRVWCAFVDKDYLSIYDASKGDFTTFLFVFVKKRAYSTTTAYWKRLSMHRSMDVPLRGDEDEIRTLHDLLPSPRIKMGPRDRYTTDTLIVLAETYAKLKARSVLTGRPFAQLFALMVKEACLFGSPDTGNAVRRLPVSHHGYYLLLRDLRKLPEMLSLERYLLGFAH